MKRKRNCEKKNNYNLQKKKENHREKREEDEKRRKRKQKKKQNHFITRVRGKFINVLICELKINQNEIIIRKKNS